MALVKSEKEIDLIREAGQIVAETLKYIGDFVKEGVTTKELDIQIEEL